MGVLILILIIVLLIRYLRKSSSVSQNEKMKIALQNYVSTPHSNLVMSDKELERAANTYLNKCRREMERCLLVLGKADTPKLYFQKLNDYKEIKKDIEGLRNVWIGTFSVKFLTEKEAINLTNDMIDRYWHVCKEKSINASSEKSKKNAFHSFFDTLDLYSRYLTKENVNLISSYRSKFQDMFTSNTIDISR